jgi:peptide deformylase
MPILKLLYYGHPFLRRHSEPIAEITEEIKQLALDMVEVMDANNGIGLAAPQVGHLIRLFILRNYIELPDGRLQLSAPQVFINPKLSNASQEMIIDAEGCLSLPGFHVPVPRPAHVTIEALDLDGNPFKEERSEYKARVVMHENDHLNGVLQIDRTDRASRKKIEPYLRELKKKYNPKE